MKRGRRTSWGRTKSFALGGCLRPCLPRCGSLLDDVLVERKMELARGAVSEDTAWAFDEFLRSHGYNVPTDTVDYRRVHRGMLEGPDTVS